MAANVIPDICVFHFSKSTDHAYIPGFMQDMDPQEKSGLVTTFEERWLENKGQICKGQIISQRAVPRGAGGGCLDSGWCRTMHGLGERRQSQRSYM